MWEHEGHKAVKRKGEEGLALIMVLAIIAILGIMVLEFSASVLIDMDISNNFYNRTQAEYNARAGLQFAIKLLRDDPGSTSDSLQDAWAEPQEIYIGDLVKHYEYETEKEEDFFDEEEEKPEPEDQGMGKAYILIIDEERKLNINKLVPRASTHDENVKEIITLLFTTFLFNLQLDQENPKLLKYQNLTADELIENIIDWIDADDIGNGEASAYYDDEAGAMFEPRNAPFESIYELLLVKGMDNLLLFGDTPFPLQESGREEDEEAYGEYDYDYDAGNILPEAGETERMTEPVYGLSNFITVHSSGLVNVNTAPREVLMALFDDETIVSEIIEARLEEPLKRFDQVKAIFSDRIAGGEYTKKVRYISFRSSRFWVESIGEYRNSRVKIVALVERRGNREARILYQRIENMSSKGGIPFMSKSSARGR